jgi:serine/threonine protein kinase
VPAPYQAHFADVLAVARQVAEGCQYLHSRGIVHRDLKPDNVLLMEPLASSADLLRVKICDFSNARVLAREGEHAGQAMTVGYGTLEWMAPELVSGDGHYGEGVDVYAFGMMLYALLTLTEPHQGIAAALAETKQATEAKAGAPALAAESSGGGGRGSLSGRGWRAPSAAKLPKVVPPLIGPASFMHALCIDHVRPKLDHHSRVPTPLSSSSLRARGTMTPPAGRPLGRC